MTGQTPEAQPVQGPGQPTHTDLEAAEQVARSDLAESAAAYLAARISGDRQAIETAADTVDRCLLELSHRHGDRMQAAWDRAVEAHRAEPEPEAGT